MELSKAYPQVVNFSSCEYKKDETVFIINNSEVSCVDRNGIWVMSLESFKKIYPVLIEWLKLFCKGIPADFLKDSLFSTLNKIEVLPDVRVN